MSQLGLGQDILQFTNKLALKNLYVHCIVPHDSPCNVRHDFSVFLIDFQLDVALRLSALSF